MMKKLKAILVVLILGITVSLFKANVLAKDFSVYLDNQEIELLNDIFIENERVMVPLREICEALGYDVNWDGWHRQITVMRTGQISYILFEIDSFDVETFDGKNTMEVAPKIIKGRTYLPLRALVENLDDNIIWDDSSRTIHMAKNPKYDRVKSYNVENVESAVRSEGYLPQIVNPSNGESKINENILLRLSDKDEDRVFSGIKTSVFRNDYKYEIRNNQNNIFSVLYEKTSNFSKVKEGMNYPHDMYYFCDTFYKDTGEKLQIEDILKGTKEEINDVIFDAYNKEVQIKKLPIDDSSFFRERKAEAVTLGEWIRKQLDRYNFYVEDDNLVFIVITSDNYIYKFKLNIPDNANLFQEDFLKNFNF